MLKIGGITLWGWLVCCCLLLLLSSSSLLLLLFYLELTISNHGWKSTSELHCDKSQKIYTCLRKISWYCSNIGIYPTILPPWFSFVSHGFTEIRVRISNHTHGFYVRSLQWRHNGHDSVSNHQPHHCLLNRLFRRRFNKTSKLRVTGLCAGNSPVTGEFPAQMASNAENYSIWWRHHVELLKEWMRNYISLFYINRKWQDYVYIQCEYKSTKQKLSTCWERKIR